MSDNSKEVVLPSGAMLLMNMATITAAFTLNDVVLKTLMATGRTSADPTSLDPESIIALVSSEGVREAVFKCAEKAVYLAGGKGSAAQRITMSLFDDQAIGAQIRGDYFDLVAAVINFNTVPFYQARISASKVPTQTGPKNPQ
jgi:hypothetical protein